MSVAFKPKSTLLWLLPAATLHLLATVTIFLSDHFHIVPRRLNSDGLGNLVSDGRAYLQVAAEMVFTLKTAGVSVWWQFPAPFHCRLYSIPLALFGNVLGFNILSTEPLNLVYYLAFVTLTYRLGKELFNERTAFISATIVALWPSLLLHSTQVIRDPLFICCFLSLLLVMTHLLNRALSWRASLITGAAGAFLATVVWLTRGNMWNVVVLLLFVTGLLFLIQLVQGMKLLLPNAFALVLISLVALLAPARLESRTLPGTREPSAAIAIPSSSRPAPAEGMVKRLMAQLVVRRQAFQRQDNHSNIDTDVRLMTAKDVLKYLPRATEIGFLVPFPTMWFSTAGATGRAARILAGAETLVMYVLYVFAAACLWKERRRLSLWLLVLVAGGSMIALGLVVVNAGALYRLRYTFWIMLIVLGARGVSDFLCHHRFTPFVRQT
jgi:hypothetical protein